MHWLICHAQFSHLFLMDLLNGGVPELFMEGVDEGVPLGVSISWTLSVGVIIVRRNVPVAVAKVYPPVLSGTFEERGGEHHHLRVKQEVLSKCFEIHLTVPKEMVNVVVLPLEFGWDC